MSEWQWLELAAGIFVVGLMLYDVFASVVVPRMVSPTLRLSVGMVRLTWRLWKWYALGIKDPDKREDSLGRYAPAVLVLLLIVWLIGLLLGYGLVFYALRAHTQPPIHSYFDAVYFAGASMLTIGYGDIVATGDMTRLFSLAAGATGLALFALIISFIFSIFGAFQRRELFIVMMGSRAGAPASGVTFLESAGKYKLYDDLVTSMREAEAWAASVLESHLAYPTLTYFRSSHDDESWVGTLGAMLDAATLLMTIADSPYLGQAKLLHNICVHLVRDLSRYFRLEGDDVIGIDRREFDQACAQLSAAGWSIHADDEAWRRFAALRMQYAGPLNAMAAFWAIPPARWIGDRSEISARSMHAAVTR
ncbi:MAG TPA: potassium channel family protein [Candidatus Eremiobacteraceae bacterium]|nr:potassium channel family protein [Candidatus Eremiobacteraceae bacterium]